MKDVGKNSVRKKAGCRRRRGKVSTAAGLILVGIMNFAVMQLDRAMALQVVHHHPMRQHRRLQPAASKSVFVEAKNARLSMTKASSSSSKNDDKVPDTTISVSKILQFAIPAMGIWICSPLLSVIDTSAVGLLSGTIQQAALNPAVALTDYAVRCMAFLFTATTNLVALSNQQETASNKKEDGDRQSAAHKKKLTPCTDTMVGALRVSLRVGILMCVVLLLFGNVMLRGLIVDTGSAAQEQVVAAACKYVWIRALGMPAAAMIGTAQAACLGMQDTTSPLMTTILAAVVNLVADVALVGQDHAWIGGVAGAAWATILSQYVAVAFYLQWLVKGGDYSSFWPTKIFSNLPKIWSRNKDKTGIESKKPLLAPLTIQAERRSVRGMLKDKLRVRDLFVRQKGQQSSAQDFAPYVIPVTMTQVGRCSVYAAMGIVVSSMDVVNMAANQILSSFFYTLIPVADSLSQTAQALLPPLFSSENDISSSTKEGVARLRSALTSFVKAAILCGTGLAGIVALVPFLTKVTMTTDIAVQSIVNSVVPIHILITLFHGIFYASEGILLAQKDLAFLGKVYGIYFVVVPTLLLQLLRYGPSLRLQTLWYAFMAYQFVRISVWVVRVYYLFHKRVKAAAT